MIDFVENDRGFFFLSKTGKNTDGTLFIKTNSSAKTASLDSLVIWDEKQRRRGIGRALIQKAISYLKNNGYKHLFVKPDENAVEFYLKVGFVKASFGKNNYVFNLVEQITL